jgi:site-specific DNA recombinase
MVGNPNHGRLYYRCTASRDFVRQHQISHPPALYLRQDAITEPIDRFLRDELTGRSLTENLRRVADAQFRAALTAHDATGEVEDLRRTITDADTKINRYRATLDAGGDPALVSTWINEATALKKAAQARLGLTEAPPQRMPSDQLDAIAEAFTDLFRLLRDADPRDKAELYSRIGL